MDGSHLRRRRKLPNPRKAEVDRVTRETNVHIALNLDGCGEAKVSSGNMFFDHMLETLSFYCSLNLTVKAEEKTKVDRHHLVEDVGLTLGQALGQALGEKKGINRFGSAVVPMDDALVLVALDLSGRAHFESNLQFKYSKVGGLPSEMVNHFLKSLAEAGRFNLHVVELRGANDHHRAEAVFKALGMALAHAVKPQGHRGIPSLKGAI